MNENATTHSGPSQGQPQPHPQPVTILVNKAQVQMPDRKATGREIKEAAIKRSVNIRLDFVLFRDAGNSQHLVRDDQEVELHDNEAFRAVDPDDNS